MPIVFAAFDVALPPEADQHINRLHQGITQISPAALLPAMFDSASRCHPSCCKAVLTDQQTKLSVPPSVAVHRFKIDGGKPMLGRLMAQAQFLSTVAEATNVAFVDSDMLIQHPIDDLFSTSFDVAVTYRTHEKWPVNAGLILAHGKHLPQARAFFAGMLAIFHERYSHESIWGGDQSALREIVGDGDWKSPRPWIRRTSGGFTVLMLPCEDYNFSHDEMVGPFPKPHVLHFKGNRKRHMLNYWSQFIRPVPGRPDKPPASANRVQTPYSA